MCCRCLEGECLADLTTAAVWGRGVIGSFPKHHGAADLRRQWVFGAATRAMPTNCDRKHMASVLGQVEAVVVASRACGYLPRYVACTDYRAGTSCSPDYCSPGLHLSLDAGLKGEVVGVAGGKLGSWLKMENNYPSLLSRNDAEKSQYGPGPEAYMVLGAKHWLASLSVILLDCLWASAVVTTAAHCCCQPA